MGTRFLLLTLIISTIIFTSCTTTSKVAYFQNAQDSMYYNQVVGKLEAPLQANDFISMSITSANVEASEVFNPIPLQTQKTANASAKAAQYFGYLISEEGYIELPILGKIMAAGLTKTQLKNHITSLLLQKKLLKDPLVDIRFLNFEVTVLGEVAAPNVISVPSEKISLLKALGMVGDMTIYGKRDNVLLIREENGVKNTHRIDLNSGSFLNSEYYYLKPNDVVYVEPNKAKVAISGRSQQVLPLVLTSVSILVFVLDKVIK